jgi:hypothetical protein
VFAAGDTPRSRFDLLVRVGIDMLLVNQTAFRLSPINGGRRLYFVALKLVRLKIQEMGLLGVAQTRAA